MFGNLIQRGEAVAEVVRSRKVSKLMAVPVEKDGMRSGRRLEVFGKRAEERQKKGEEKERNEPWERREERGSVTS
jgi:hypothetical protein